ncbi:hypothetical protein VT84_13630 [Gemmata sp. SH-PL17]|uniref:hypothetical protein n=1 Tax=Gemmata sp. SH-PL17 TaxID=1630693 RepID=UPI00078DD489|nr:hypothetical protein [Gemmata sp. SH-PL17]AMV25437.1 hypothetical protein VT84_13630 [Gemmata sp. SH-PL17]
MILHDDIYAAVKAALAPQGATFPGGAHPNRGPDVPSAYPYVVFAADPEPAELQSGPTYTQKWTVTATAYAQAGQTPQILDVQKALASALAVDGAPVVAALRNATERVMASVPVVSNEDYAPELRDGKDVMVTSQSCQLYCQGDRSVA